VCRTNWVAGDQDGDRSLPAGWQLMTCAGPGGPTVIRTGKGTASCQAANVVCRTRWADGDQDRDRALPAD
jgi:hypothetical protein